MLLLGCCHLGLQRDQPILNGCCVSFSLRPPRLDLGDGLCSVLLSDSDLVRRKAAGSFDCLASTRLGGVSCPIRRGDPFVSGLLGSVSVGLRSGHTQFCLGDLPPGEFHPEPLTDPDLSLSTYPARAIARRLPPSVERRLFPANRLAQINGDDPPPSLQPHYRAFTATTRQSAPLRRIGTFGLAVRAACAFSLGIAGKVLTFHAGA